LADQAWRLVPQWVLPGNDAAQIAPWRMGADGVLYLKMGMQVQGLHITDKSWVVSWCKLIACR